MLMRIWKTTVDPLRVAEYEQFAREISLPMFRQQKGFRGVMMGRDQSDCIVTTLWDDAAAIAALDTSASYKSTVAHIIAEGFLGDDQSVSVFSVHDAWP